MVAGRTPRPPDAQRAGGISWHSAFSIVVVVDPTQQAEPASASEPAPGREEPDDSASPFVIRNLDTGEAISIPIDDQLDADKVRARLTFGGTLSSNTEAWTALKAETRGLLEKLATKTTLSFRSYQLCVWQERYVFAEDEGLYYQHLSAEMVPVGTAKRIPYSTIEFVGPFDETQFVLKCADRAYTFLCDSMEARTRWIKNISQLAGCSASTQVCHKTQVMGH